MPSRDSEAADSYCPARRAQSVNNAAIRERLATVETNMVGIREQYAGLRMQLAALSDKLDAQRDMLLTIRGKALP